MRLRTRMALISATAVAIVVVVSVLLAQTVARQELMREIDESLEVRAAEVNRSPRSVVDLFASRSAAQDSDRSRFRRFGPDALLGRGTTGFDALFVQVLGPEGQVWVPPDQPVVLPVAEADYAFATGGRPTLRTVDVEGDRIRMITSPLGDEAALQIGRSLEEFDETVSGVTRRLTLAGAAGVALAGVLGLLVARSALRPVDDLTKTVEHVAETKVLAARIDVERDDEVGRLAKSFNDMLEALEESRVQQQQLVRDAGHELRTPLTALRTNIELLARARTLSDEQRTELLDAATEELRELSELAAELVDLAADPAGVTEVPQLVEIGELVERVVDRFRRRTGREIEFTSRPFTAEVSVSAVERAVGNLIDNANKWSPDGEAIVVHVAGGRITVRDHGPGIAPGDTRRVFDRFYRADSARTTPGSGLGLAIVKKVVEDHGGEVFVEQPDDGGALVGFTLPTGGV